MSNCAGLAGHAIVEDRVVGGGLGIHQFVKIGRNAMVGGMAKVVQDIPPYVIADGQPGVLSALTLLVYLVQVFQKKYAEI